MDELIVAFLRMERPDNRGRMVSDIWSFSCENLENEHDYIQWLFPLFERSAFSSDAPILTINSAEFITTDEICKTSLNRSLSIMQYFYRENSHWAKPNNHNLLRITRILKSVALLLGKVPSIEFYSFIMMRCNELVFKPSSIVIDFWNKATEAGLAQYR